MGLRLVDHRSQLVAPHGENSRAKPGMSMNTARYVSAAEDAASAADDSPRPRAVKALLDHRQHRSRREPNDLVFGNRNDEPFRESKLLERVLQPAAERAGLGRVTWHQFRHIHSTLLNDLRVPVKIAQEQLGHASIATTLNVYTHVVDASHRKPSNNSKNGCLARWTVLD